VGRAQIHPDIIQQLASKNNSKMQLPSIRQGDRRLFRRGDIKRWRNKAWEYDYYDLRGTRTTIKGNA